MFAQHWNEHRRHEPSPPLADVQDIRSLLGFDRALFLKLAACDWIAEAAILLLTGASGLGKSWLACAIRHKVCRENMSVLHTRAPNSSPIWPSPMGMSVAFATPWGMTAICVRRDKAALSSGRKSHPATAPAGSNRSSHGGDEMAEAFGIAGHV